MSVSAISISATYNDKYTIDALSDMITARVQELGESTRDAVAATAINILRSLRAATPKAKANAKDIKVLVDDAPGMVVGWHRENGRMKRCIRYGRRGPSYKGKWMNYAEKSMPDSTLSVFLVHNYPGKNGENVSCYAVAANRKTVEELVVKRIIRRIAASAGLAKTTLSIAMGRVSTRVSPVFDTARSKARATAMSSAVVRKADEGFGSGRFAVEVTDDLNYSVAASKISVETAMQKAANSAAGMMNKIFKNRGMHKAITTPFPEVKR